MNFNLIHPIIIDLYIDALSLHILEVQVEEDSDDDLLDELGVATNKFAKTAKEAEAIYGSSEAVQYYLDVFTEQSQGEA